MKKIDVDAFRECLELVVLVDTRDMDWWLDIHLAFGGRAPWVSAAGPTFFSSQGEEAACTPRISLPRMLF